MLKWDGTDITEFMKKCNIRQIKCERRTYWILEYIYNDKIEKIRCLVKNIQNTSPCVIDEMKPLFGLQKVGTHWFYYKNQLKLLINFNDLSVTTLKSVLDEDLDDNFKQKVQKIFVFRDLLGVSRTFSSNIIIDKNGNIVSLYEPKMVIDNDKILPNNVIDRWFNEDSIDQITKEMLNINSLNEIPKKLHYLRMNIDKIIERVDVNAIGYKTCILDKITRRLQSSI